MSVSWREYQGLCEQSGQQGLGRGASRNGGEINLEEPEPKEPELAPESKHRRVILEGKHCKPLCLSTYIRQGYLHSVVSNLLSKPSPPNWGSNFIVCLMQQKPKRSNSPEGNRT